MLSYEIVGYVFDANTKTPLVGASVRLEGTNYGGFTNNEGKFVLKNIGKGRFSVIVSFVGYNTLRTNISVSTDDTIHLYLTPKIIQTEELVVSASKKLQTVQEVPVSVSILTNEIYTTRNYVRLDEALRYVPGVVINKDNVNIRGSSGFSFGLGSRVSYLMDGFQMLSGDNADAKYDIIPTLAIDKIEIVKGAGSSLYGSSAIGGVINVIAKEPSDTLTYSVEFQSGIYTKSKYEQWIYTDKLTSRTKLSGYISDELFKVKVLAAFTYVNDESYRLFDKSQRTNLFCKLTKDLKNYGKISLSGFYSTDKRNDWVYWNSLDSATRPPTGTDLSRYLVSNKANLSLDYKFILTNRTFVDFKSSILNTLLDNKLKVDDPEYRKSNAFSYFNELQLNTHFGDNTLLTYGVNYTRNWVESSIYGKHKQNLFSLFSQVEVSRFLSSTITLGGRFDIEKSDSSKYYYEFSPKIGVNYLLAPNKTIRFSLGRGFRSPALAERFATIKYGGFEVVPNYKLKSEFSWSSEIGTMLELEEWIFPVIFDVSMFYSYYNDLIEPTFNTDVSPVIRFENISKARIYGIEFSTKALLFKKIPFSIGVTYLDPKDLNDNQILKYRSRFSLVSTLSLPYKFITTTVDFRYISKIERLDEILKLLVADYDAIVPIYVVDLNLALNLKEFGIPITLNFSVQNLLDYYYVEMVGNLAPTRHLSLRVLYNK
jgi:iron complex outermembrane receptor protein